VRLILDGTVVRVRLDRQATSIVLLVVHDVRADLINRGLRRPEFLIVD
jgi:putative transposase